MKGRGLFIAVFVMAVAGLWRDSTVAAVFRYAAMAYVLVSLLLQARAGYLRRRPHWTRDSWRRFLSACAVFAAALVICICMAAAVDFRVPITGPANSTQRGIWVGVMLLFMLVGAGGLTSAIFWLTEGDPSKPFTRFQRQRSLP